MELKRLKRLLLSCVIINCFNIVVSQGASSCYECGLTTPEIRCGYSPGSQTSCTDIDGGCFIQLFEDTESDIPGYYTRRGCVENLPGGGTCQDDDPYCKICNEANCNNEIIPDTRHSCRKCGGNICSNEEQVKEEKCGVFEDGDDSCITLFEEDGSVLFRGCYADVANTTQDICDDATQISCIKCQGANCNTETERLGHKCYKCQGLECFEPKNPEDVIDCLSDCYVGLNAQGENVRDCSSAIGDVTNCGTLEEGKECVVCSEDLCNGEVFPTTRLSCLSCADDGCEGETPASKNCQRVGDDETCLTIFDADGKVIERGCSSSVTNKQNCEENAENCVSCTSDDCNNDSSKDPTGKCISCDSKTDPNCVLNPTNSVSCSTECYTKLLDSEENSGQHIERGCLASGVTCEEPECEKCSGENCNNQKFPSDRISCLKCQGESCSNEEIPQELCIRYGANQGCLTYYEDSIVIYKDCYLDAVNETQIICDDESQIDCTKCLEENCNVDTTRRGNKCYICQGLECFEPNNPEDLTDCTSSCYVGLNSEGENVRDCSSAIGNVTNCGTIEEQRECATCLGDFCNGEVYPIVRLSCLHCLDGCQEEAEVESRQCPRVDSSEFCVTIFDENNAVIERGCSSRITNEEICVTTENCIPCETNDCNTDTSKDPTGKCISCDSKTDPNCVLNPTNSVSCSGECYTKLLDSEENGGQHIERGCLASGETCTEPECEKCTGKNCNNQKFPTDRISCHKCQGESCSNEEIPQELCIRYGENQGCLTYYEDNNVIYKDCYLDAVNETQIICDDESQIDCTKCLEENCNDDTIRRGNKCYRCSGIDCFEPNFPADSIDCTTECYYGLNINGENIRGCLNELSDPSFCQEKDMCLTCSEDYCNQVEYPIEGRLECLICSGTDCQESSDESQKCPVFGSSETCVTVFDETEDLVIARGCSSDVEIGRQCVDNENCRNCNESNCNSETSKVTFSCISCSSKDDPNCVLDPASTTSVSCSSKLCYNRLIDTEDGERGQHTERGCTANLPQDFTCSEPNCVTCDSDSCNSNKYPSDRISCQKCRDSGCSGPEINTELCILYEENGSCLSFYDSPEHVIYRNCYSDAPNATREICDNEFEIDCTKCQGENCNIDSKRRGTKCFGCNGLECFQPEYPADEIDCLSECYVGLNLQGENVRGCLSDLGGSDLCKEEDNCLICEEDLCNAMEYPTEGRLECLSCSDVDCQEASVDSEHCPTFSPNEACVTAFDEDDTVLARGCASQVLLATICTDNENCKSCNESNCNTDTSKISYSCISCDSSIDPGCIEDPKTTASCKTEQCYNQLIGQHIKRGCYDEEEIGSCESPNCEKCTGHNCNNGIFPEDRASCYFCDKENCNGELSSKYCLIYSGEENQSDCLTYYSNETTAIYRNCFADSPMETQNICKDETQISCSKCSTNNCNNDQKRRGNVCYKCEGLYCFTPNHPADAVDCLSDCYVGLNEKGENIRDCSSTISDQNCGEDDGTFTCNICQGDYCNALSFPLNGRLKCYTCLGEECETDKENDQYCLIHGHDEMCASVYDDSKNLIERGCLSTLLNKEPCDSNSENCEKCSTDGCNSPEDPSVEKIRCAACNSSVDPNCVLDPLLTTYKECNEGCFTKIDGQDLIRGCSEELMGECTGELCKICKDKNNCNNQMDFPKPRLSCYKCSGEDCLGDLTPMNEICINYRSDEKCVVLFNGYNLARKGCLSDLSTEELGKCSGTHAECLECSETNCNTAIIRPDEKCIICNSRDESKCSQYPSTLTPAQCGESGNGTCYGFIDGVDTIRGCFQTLPNKTCMDKENCATCVGQGCNNNEFPPDRQGCYHCDSRNDENCKKAQTDESKIIPCKNYVSGDTCVEIRHDSHTIRECKSDNNEICSTNPDSCTYFNEKGGNKNFGSKLQFNSLILLISILIGLSSVNNLWKC